MSTSSVMINNLEKLFKPLSELIHNSRLENGEYTTSVRFALISFSLIGGSGRSVDRETSQLLAYRSLATRLCELGVVDERIVRHAEEWGEEAISLILDDMLPAFQEVVEYIMHSHQVPVKVRISKSWDACLHSPYTHQLTQAMQVSLGEYWQEMDVQWPDNMRDGQEVQSVVKNEDSFGDSEQSTSQCETTSLTSPDWQVRVKQEPSEDDDVQIIGVQSCKRSAELSPEQPRRHTAKRQRRRTSLDNEQETEKELKPLSITEEEQQPVEEPVEQYGEGVDPCSHQPEEQKTEQEYHEVGQPVVEERVERADTAMEKNRSILCEIARLCGTTVEEDDATISFSGIDPVFLSVRKCEGTDPYQAVLDQLVEWSILPMSTETQSSESEYYLHISTLWSLLHPLIIKYNTGQSTGEERTRKMAWKAKEMRDVGRRFWKDPQCMERVRLPIAASSFVEPKEKTCHDLVYAISQTASLEVVVRRTDPSARLQFLSFPPELIGGVAFVDESTIFSSFVMHLCDCGLLPPFHQVMFLLTGSDRRAWRDAITHAVSKVISFVKCYYYERIADAHLVYFGVEKSHVKQRRDIVAYMTRLWAKTTVLLPEGVRCKYALSFQCSSHNSEGDLVHTWSSDAELLTEEKWREEREMGESSTHTTPDNVSPVTARLASAAPPEPVSPTPPTTPVDTLPATTSLSSLSNCQAVENTTHTPTQLTPQPYQPAPAAFVAQTEEEYYVVLQSISHVIGRPLVHTYVDSYGKESVFFEGIRPRIMHGKRWHIFKKYESLLKRLRELNLIPAHMYKQCVVPSSEFALQLNALFMLVNDYFLEFATTYNLELIHTISRASFHFWQMDRRPVEVYYQPYVEWVEREEGEGRKSSVSRFSRWFVCQVASRANTSLVIGRDSEGTYLIWFRSVAFKKIGATTKKSCYFTAFMSHLRSRKVIPPLDDLEKNKELLESTLVNCATLISQLTQMERAEK